MNMGEKVEKKLHSGIWGPIFCFLPPNFEASGEDVLYVFFQLFLSFLIKLDWKKEINKI